jgi:hypothetical protein
MMPPRRINVCVCFLALSFDWTLESYAFELRSPTYAKPGIQIRRHFPVVLFNTPGGDVDTAEAFTGDYIDGTYHAPSGDDSSVALEPPVLIDSAENAISMQLSEDEQATATATPFFAYVVESKTKTRPSTNITTAADISRREWLERSAKLLFGGIIIGGAISQNAVENNPKPKPVTPKAPSLIPQKLELHQPMPPPPKKPAASDIGKLSPVNLTQVAAETDINVTMNCDKGCVSVDKKNFTKMQTAKNVPGWLPDFLKPSPKIVKEVSNSELLIASSIAGGFVEMGRNSLLYPIQTIKTRIQTDVHNFTLRSPPMEDRLLNLGTSFKRHVNAGDLYAGIKPSLLVSVPAIGVYYGVRDVSKRMLSMTVMDDIAIALGAALIADVVSLYFRTPADALSLRLQNQDDEGDWIGDSYRKLPMVIVTDLPYLLSKIILNRQFIHGSRSIDRYAEVAILTAVVAAFLTTPFDVDRTRILIDNDGDFSNGIDGGSGDGVFNPMVAITKEGRGGIVNLFAGWLERVLYLGIGRAWLEAIQMIGYVGIRDVILLEWF